MIIAGIIEEKSNQGTTNLIKSFFSLSGKTIEVVKFRYFLEWGVVKSMNYIGMLKNNSIDTLIVQVNLEDLEKDFSVFFKFEVIIFPSFDDDLIESLKNEYSDIISKTSKLLQNNAMVIINNDNDCHLDCLNNETSKKIITYGFSSKADLTASSVGDSVLEEICICYLQETLKDRNGGMVEPQEFLVRLKDDIYDPYVVMAATSFAVLNGININSFTNKLHDPVNMV